MDARPPGLPGDYNFDGSVNAADYVVWRKNPSRTQAEYDLWRANFGQPGGGSGAGPSGALSEPAAAVPEPASAMLLAIGLARVGESIEFEPRRHDERMTNDEIRMTND